MELKSLPKNENGLDRKVTISVTRREMLLLELCISVAEHRYAKSDSLSTAIQRLTDKLAAGQEQSA